MISPSPDLTAGPAATAGSTTGGPVVAGPRLRRVVWWLGSTFTVVTLVVGLFNLLAAVAFDRHLVTTTLAAADLASVEVVTIDNSAGEVRIQGTGTAGARLETDVGDGLFRARHRQHLGGGALRLDASCPLGFATRCHVHHHLVVPSSLAVEVKGRMGAIDVADVDGRLDIDGTFGPLTIDGVTGPVAIDHRFGTVTARRLGSSRVELSSHFGDNHLGFITAPTDVSVTTAFGSTLIELPDDGEAYRVTGRSDLGHRVVEVRVDPTSERRIHVDSTAGEVTIRYAR